MVKSMTGFGKGEAALQNKKITVEIRSLNSKQLDLGLRLPAVYRQSEYEIRNIIARTIPIMPLVTAVGIDPVHFGHADIHDDDLGR